MSASTLILVLISFTLGLFMWDMMGYKHNIGIQHVVNDYESPFMKMVVYGQNNFQLKDYIDLLSPYNSDVYLSSLFQRYQIDPEEYVYIFKVQTPKTTYILTKTLSQCIELEKSLSLEILINNYSSLTNQIIEGNQFRNLVIIEDFINKIVSNAELIIEKPLIAFMETQRYISGYQKLKEIEVEMKQAGYFSDSWIKSHLVLFNEGIIIQNCNNKAIFGKQSVHNIILFDSHFKVKFGQAGQQDLEFEIQTSQGTMSLKASDIHLFLEMMYSLDIVQKQSEYTKEQRYKSSFPNRNNNTVQWFIDGQDYFSEVSKQIQNANTSIFISDWWFSPELYLNRPNKQRLDILLAQKASEGVTVNIVIYREFSFWDTMKYFYQNSSHTEKRLESLSPNINVIRHPDQVLPSQWSHHEKSIIIDNQIGFLGGIDLCYGRWDNTSHSLTDSVKPNQINYFPGQDYNNPRIKEFENVYRYDQTLVNRNKFPRMPWHDIALKIEGPSVKDLVKHFTQSWNHQTMDLSNADIDEKNYNYIIPQQRSTFKNLKSQFPSLMQDSLRQMKNHKKYKKIQISSSLNDIFSQTNANLSNNNFPGTCKAQLVRSGPKWSIGVKEEYTESSIHNAYIQLIENSKHFIYIENQFFISSLSDESFVHNKIAEALVKRIKQAAQKQEDFLVMVVLPLMPGIEGEVDNENAAVIRTQLYYQYKTISRGGNSIYEQLQKDQNIKDPKQYIKFISLRNHGLLNNVPVTEEIYVHSKLMIIDDDIALIGSANINDRSMLGNRDSELAFIIEDDKKIQSKINGQTTLVSEFSHSLRSNLFQEIFGFSSEEVKDPLDKNLLQTINNRVQANTLLYRKIFYCYPDDTIKNYQQLEQSRQNQNLDQYSDLKEKIKGFAVEFPLTFLDEEDLYFKWYKPSEWKYKLIPATFT